MLFLPGCSGKQILAFLMVWPYPDSGTKIALSFLTNDLSVFTLHVVVKCVK
jgi:hypothetical protein